MLKQILAALAAGATALSALAMDLTEEQRAEIAERLAPVGKVCLQGDSSCVVKASAPSMASGSSASGGSGAASGGEAGSESGDAAASGDQVAAASIDGEAVYNQACVACHSTGAAGAPMVGNVEQWEPRIAKGMEALHGSGINGIAGTSMLAKGGRSDLSDAQVIAAVDYMVENSQ